MIKLENYLYDGACWQARAVMCYLQSMTESILDATYNGDSFMPFDGQLYISHYENGREKGYVFSVCYKDHQSNYAVYEHCVGDHMCIVKSSAVTANPNGWDGKEWSKSKHTKEFSFGEIKQCGDWIANDIKKDLNEWCGYDEEKKELVGEIRKAAKENGGFNFLKDKKKKVFYPNYFGEKRKEVIVEISVSDDDEECVTIATEYEDESGEKCYEYTDCSYFSNDEIREIIKLIGIER